MEGLYYQNKRVLITGASGFVGRHLVQRLNELGARIVVITRQSAVFSSPVTIKQGDLCDIDFVKSVMVEAKPEIVFHLAADKSRSVKIEDFSTSLNINLLGTLNLLTAISNLAAVKSIVILGTAEEYGHNPCPFREDMRESPITSYSFSKLCATQLGQVFHRLYQMPLSVIRPALVYGPGQDIDMFLPDLIRSLIAKEPFKMTTGVQTRDYIYVSDLIEALIFSAMSSSSVGEIINVGSGVPVSIRSVAEIVGKLMNKSHLIKFGEKSQRSNDIMEYSVDISKAKSLLGWTPLVGLEQGLKKTIQYFSEVQNIETTPAFSF